jgi:hypothetical protein
VQAYQTSQYMVPCGGIFLGKWRTSFAGNSDCKMNVQTACALNTQYVLYYLCLIFNVPLLAFILRFLFNGSLQFSLLLLLTWDLIK